MQAGLRLLYNETKAHNFPTMDPYMVSTFAAYLFHHKGLEFGSCKIVQKEETHVPLLRDKL